MHSKYWSTRVHKRKHFNTAESFTNRRWPRWMLLLKLYFAKLGIKLIMFVWSSTTKTIAVCSFLMISSLLPWYFFHTHSLICLYLVVFKTLNYTNTFSTLCSPLIWGVIGHIYNAWYVLWPCLCACVLQVLQRHSASAGQSVSGRSHRLCDLRGGREAHE